tara:strand:- start:296 stop:436 length:141 start_codon:yes stop_codon:yes gene_type:complete
MRFKDSSIFDYGFDGNYAYIQTAADEILLTKEELQEMIVEIENRED